MKTAEVYLSKWSEETDTYKTMKRALNRIAKVLGGKDAESFDWHKLRFEETRGVAARLKTAKLGPASINKHLTALRGVLDVAWRSEDLPDKAYRKIEIENVRGDGEKAGRALEPAELDAVESCLGQLSPHDAALIAVLAGAGLRRVEATKLRKRDYNPQTGRLTAKGKGDKIREVPVGDRWRKYIEAWCDIVLTRELFPISRRQVSLVVQRFCVENDLKRFTPHDLRKTFATHICRVSDIAIAQRLLGHANINTTATIYDRRGVEAEDEAVKGL